MRMRRMRMMSEIEEKLDNIYDALQDVVDAIQDVADASRNRNVLIQLFNRRRE